MKSYTLEDLEKKWEEDRAWKKAHPVKAWVLDLRYVPIRFWNGLEWKYLAVKHGFQRMFRGYDDTAYWSLDNYIRKIALPVIRDYRSDGKLGVPMLDGFSDSSEDFDKMTVEWHTILDKMIVAFELLEKDEMADLDYSPESMQKIEEGLTLFGKHLRSLWN